MKSLTEIKRDNVSKNVTGQLGRLDGFHVVSLDQIIRPTCAICEKPVDEVRIKRDMLRHKYLVQVYCHGDSENVYLEDYKIISATKIEVGEAFSQKRLK